MVNLAKRIEELRNKQGLSRPGLSAQLGFPKQAIEKFETGRLTPTKQQQEKLAEFFGVSLFYLRGESNDPTRMENWLDLPRDEVDETPVRRPAPKPVQTRSAGEESGNVMGAFLNSKPFQEMLKTAVLDTLRSPEGQEILSRVVRRELDRRG